MNHTIFGVLPEVDRNRERISLFLFVGVGRLTKLGVRGAYVTMSSDHRIDFIRPFQARDGVYRRLVESGNTNCGRGGDPIIALLPV